VERKPPAPGLQCRQAGRLSPRGMSHGDPMASGMESCFGQVHLCLNQSGQGSGVGDPDPEAMVAMQD
jgi:hypothetical protein